MRNKIYSFLSAIIAIVYWFFREAILAWFFDKVVHKMDTWESYLIEYGIPTAFAILCIRLLLKQSDKAAKTIDPSFAGQKIEIASSTNAPVYLTAIEVIRYLADESQWGVLKASEVTPQGMKKNVRLEAPVEFQQRAAEGKITVYGFNSLTHKHELVPKTFWMSYGLDIATIFSPDSISRTVPTALGSSFLVVGTGVPVYSDLKIEAEGIYKAWPRKSPIEIIFEPTNPGGKYWAPTNIDNGKGVPVPIWEYRALIRNTHDKTIKGVRATVETLGTRPMKQEFALFQINQEQAIDLHPLDEKFIVVLRWWYPARQAGLPYGESFYELTGDLKIVVNAEDTLPAIRTFRFDYDKEPMLFD